MKSKHVGGFEGHAEGVTPIVYRAASGARKEYAGASALRDRGNQPGSRQDNESP
jgi:hypothetical protein